MPLIEQVKRTFPDTMPLPFFEFFAGAGMARLGLGSEWRSVFANDICEKKAAAYRAFFGECPELLVRDVANVMSDELPGTPALVWASFPCQDLSLAGAGAGLNGRRSGVFRPFWKLVRSMIEEGRAPNMIVLENVVGTLTSHNGLDFQTIIQALTDAGYKVGSIVIDAVRFLPQSRPRLFVIGVLTERNLPPILSLPGPSQPWHTRSIREAHARLSAAARANWVWWHLPIPNAPISNFGTVIEEKPVGVEWHTEEETTRLIALMSPVHRKKLDTAIKLGKHIVGTVYKRSRPDERGENVQRAEIRFDQISGCLRTPAGGSSRQIIVVVEGMRVRSRLLAPREAARLMGVPDSYPLPTRYNDAYHLFGDGVAVPVVSWLNKHVLLPVAAFQAVGKAA